MESDQKSIKYYGRFVTRDGIVSRAIYLSDKPLTRITRRPITSQWARVQKYDEVPEMGQCFEMRQYQATEAWWNKARTRCVVTYLEMR